ncbi:MAG: hypothetical protein KDI90_10870 [Alphaproteobacteria bacterium]|nr:hypothetical protein [Alphaproteobacteria bacterium]MCB9975625.1 hypothetical protein [Rhodospirillales bacterium]
MTVDRKTALHICKVIARQIQSGYPDLTLKFAVHEERNRQKALVRETPEIQEHPAGQVLLDYIMASKDKDITGNRSRFVGLAQHSNPGVLGFFRSTETIGLFFVNHERFKSQEDLKNHALHMVWHALALYDDYAQAEKNQQQETGTLPSIAKRKKERESEASAKKNDKDAPDSRFEISEDVILTKLEIQDQYHRNLLADIFSATFQAIHGTENAIRNLATQRMLDTLTPQLGFVSERYPYPVCLETLELLFSESMRASGRKEKGVALAARITSEIGMTYQVNAIKQWRSFCVPAQEMAWCGFKPETILGAAIYTNENTYVRSIADMVSEHLEIKPEIFSSLNDYNPFADAEWNKRLHEKMAVERYKTAMEKIRTPEDHKILLQEAAKQCQKLKGGNPIGWSAHALVALSDEIILTDPKTLAHQKKRLQTLFEQHFRRVSWENLRSFARFIFRQRRDGNEITMPLLASVPAKTEDIVLIKDTFTKLDELATLTEEAAAKEEEKSKSQGSFASFARPNALK